MKSFSPATQLCALALGACGLMTSLTGCQTTIGGQTLPSAYYLQDDVQYFPAGSEEPLPKLRQALADYRAEQEAVQQGLGVAQ